MNLVVNRFSLMGRLQIGHAYINPATVLESVIFWTHSRLGQAAGRVGIVSPAACPPSCPTSEVRQSYMYTHGVGQALPLGLGGGLGVQSTRQVPRLG